MRTEAEPNRCPKCGEPIPPEAPRGLCPRCLLRQASVDTQAGEPGAGRRPAPPPQPALAAAFPQLEIIELIGQGAMGFVFKARQPKLDRFVALKILPPSLAADPAFAERFVREARVLARLNHPNIVTIHDFGQSNGWFYLLMEFVDGVNLRQAMRVGRFTPAQALAIVPGICEALQFAHNEGILHRDIKPENVLIDAKGRVKVVDFGIAKLLAGGQATPSLPQVVTPPVPAQLTETGGALGTPRYMAPEQIEYPAEVDQRADIYSLGVVFYELLTGELPLGRFPPPSEKSPVDPRVDKVVLRALEKERERRYQQAGEVKKDVDTIAASGGNQPGQADLSPGLGALTPASWFDRLPWKLIVVACLFLVSGGVDVWTTAHDLARHRYDLQFGVLALPIGLGLLRQRPGWRIAALLSVWSIVALIIAVLVGMLHGPLLFGVPLHWGLQVIAPTVTITRLPSMIAASPLFGTYVGPNSFLIGFPRAVLVFLVLLWVHEILVRSDVKALFQGCLRRRPWIEWSALVAVFLLAWGLSHLLLATGVEKLNSFLTTDFFGPVVERTVFLNRTDRAFLSLGTRNYIQPPQGVVPADWKGQHLREWIAAGSAADLMATSNSGQPRLALIHTVFRSVPNGVWDKPWLLDDQALNVLFHWPPPSSPVTLVPGIGVPSTVVFHTAYRIAGLLQILAYPEKPEGVRIRYKLLRKTTGPARPAAASPQPANSNSAH